MGGFVDSSNRQRNSAGAQNYLMIRESLAQSVLVERERERALDPIRF